MHLTGYDISNYTVHMTIAGRNRVLIFGICIAALMLIGSILCCVQIMVKGVLGQLPKAPESSVWALNLPVFVYNNYAVTIAIAAFPLIALILLIRILFCFEKTHALEISFFSLFVFALSTEVLQLLFPLYGCYPLIAVFIAPAARIILFFRFLACLSLLTASLFAHQTFTRGTGAVIFLLSFISFALSHVTPIDTADAVSFFSFSRSYRFSFCSFNGIVCILAVVSFLFVGIYRGIAEYRKAAFHLSLMLVSYAAMQYTGSWFITVLGVPTLLIGGFFFLKAMHQFYLWQ